MQRTKTLLSSLIFSLMPLAASADDRLSLRLLGSIDVADSMEGFDEPSGLSFDPGSQTLWSVSDDTSRIFGLGPTGKLDPFLSFDVDASEMEGLAVLGSGESYLAVREDTNEILTIEARTGQITRRTSLFQLPGFELVRPDFFEGDQNKGLEGITVNPTSGRVYVIKEAEPRLLIELSPDLSSVTAHRRLTADAGFVVDGVDDTDLDVSGIAYDPSRDRFWILSDAGRSLFVYDAEENTAFGSFLQFRVGANLRRVRNAEGVALNAAANIVFVVTDDGDGSMLISYEVLSAGN